jgi:hypothetical protein
VFEYLPVEFAKWVWRGYAIKAQDIFFNVKATGVNQRIRIVPKNKKPEQLRNKKETLKKKDAELHKKEQKNKKK